MADETIKVTIVADDKASKVVDEVAKKTGKLDGTTAAVDVKADDNATGKLNKVDADRKQLDGKNANVDIKADDDATKKLDKVQREVKELDGKTAHVNVKADTAQATSKLGALKDQLKSNLPQAAAVAGAAIAKFALDGANDFAELGEKVETFKGISGTTAETASRWIAVADDYGVSAEELAGSFGKLGKTLGTNAESLNEYGVQVVRAKDGTVDLNATALNVIDTYNATVDPTIKAKLATEAFGKSYTALIPLIDEGTGTIVKRMKEVDGAQLFGDDKLRTAEHYRLAMDELQDAVKDLQMELGQKLIPVLVDVAHNVSAALGPMTDLMDAMGDDSLGKFKTGLDALTNPFATLATHLGSLEEDVGSLYAKWFSTPDLALPMKNFVDRSMAAIGEVIGGMDLTAIAAAGLAQAQEEMAQRAIQAHDELKRAVAIDVDRMKAKWAELRGGLSLDAQIINLRGDFDDVRAAGEAAFKAAQEGAVDAEQKQRDYELKIIATKQSVIDLGEEIGLSLNQTTTLVAEVDAGALDRVEERIEILRRNNKINLEIIAKKGAGFSGDPTFDTGGVVGPRGGVAGEKHSEILDGKYLTQGPTVVSPGTKVTSSRRTAVWMRRHGLKGYDSGTTGAPLPIGMANGGSTTIVLNAAVIGNRFDVMRAVARANHDANRLLGSRR